MQIHEEKNRGVYVKGLSDYYVGDQSDVYEIMRQGGLARAVSSTNMNIESSRSHSIFLVTIQQKNTDTGSQKTGNLYLVDLAGSEKVGKTGASGQTLEEAKKINKSLSALGMVINALTDGKSSHIPYRDSKLTRILQESLGGNSRTTLIINASPCVYNMEETTSTLRFGVRAKSITNKARVNAELSPTQLKVLLKKAQDEAARHQRYASLLEGELKVWRTGGQVPESERADVRSATTPATPSTPRMGGLSALQPQPPMTPQTPTTMEAIRELTSRPETPTGLSLERDERDEFLRRENDLLDQLSEKENAFENASRLLREELRFYKEQEASLSSDNEAMAAELVDVKLQLERATHKQDEASNAMDSLEKQNSELINQLTELRRSLDDKIGATSSCTNTEEADSEICKSGKPPGGSPEPSLDDLNGEVLALLENLATVDQESFPSETLARIREAMQGAAQRQRKFSSQLKEVQKDREFLLEALEQAEQRLEQLLKSYNSLFYSAYEHADGGPEAIRARIEAQVDDQVSDLRSEISELKRQMERKDDELIATRRENESLNAAHEELKRTFDATLAGIQGGHNLVENAKEMDGARHTMAQQLEEFNTMRNRLVEDLENRCAKVSLPSKLQSDHNSHSQR